jgi:FtsH-binding integral membrane protein
VLGFASLFTAGGALLAPTLAPGALWISIIGSFATLLGVYAARDRAPLNLALLYAFATFEGLALGLILESSISQGLGAAVVDAALTTAAVTLAAGVYGYTTKRDNLGAWRHAHRCVGCRHFYSAATAVKAEIVGDCALARTSTQAMDQFAKVMHV